MIRIALRNTFFLARRANQSRARRLPCWSPLLSRGVQTSRPPIVAVSGRCRDPCGFLLALHQATVTAYTLVSGSRAKGTLAVGGRTRTGVFLHLHVLSACRPVEAYSLRYTNIEALTTGFCAALKALPVCQWASHSPGLQCWQSVSWITRATTSCHLCRTCSSARQPFNWGRKCRPAFTVATVEPEMLLVADDLARRRLPAPPTLKPCVTRTGFRHLRARHRLTALLRAVKSLPRSPAATGAPEARYCAQGFDVGPPALTRREV